MFLASSASGRPAVAICRGARGLWVAGVVAVGGMAKLWTAVVVTKTVTTSTDNTASGSLIVCSSCRAPDSGQSDTWCIHKYMEVHLWTSHLLLYV